MKINFVLPGNNFSGCFVKGLVDTTSWCQSVGVQFEIFTSYAPIVHEVRNVCLGGRVASGKRQKPFDGNPYDFIMFLDQDIGFTKEDFKRLLAGNKKIIAGWYPMKFYKDEIEYASAGSFSGNGEFPLLKIAALKEKRKPFAVDVVGLGFTLVSQGVFEAIDYPWFYPTMEEIESINEKIGVALMDTIREDLAWAEKVTSAGFEIYLDPTVRVGHEKKIILWDSLK